MAFDEILAARLREALTGRARLTERKMFGGIAFMLDGHMCCGLVGAELMVRVGPEGCEDALSRPHARPMDFTGRPLTGYVYVAPGGLRTTRALQAWVERAATYVLSLPAHRPRSARSLSCVRNGGELAMIFKAKLFRYPGPGGWTFARIPKRHAPPITHGWGRTPVLARVDGVSWETSVWHDKTYGTLLPVPKRLLGEKGDGDRVAVELLPSRTRA